MRRNRFIRAYSAIPESCAKVPCTYKNTERPRRGYASVDRGSRVNGTDSPLLEIPFAVNYGNTLASAPVLRPANSQEIMPSIVD